VVLQNNKYISNIQVTSSEILGVEDRGGYYESSGALKDMDVTWMFEIYLLFHNGSNIAFAKRNTSIF
jgi:glucose-6-phosphate 1-dehydrogenase